MNEETRIEEVLELRKKIKELEEIIDGLRMNSKYYVRSMLRRTHCKNGHEYTAENTGWWLSHGSRKRTCKTCKNFFRLIRRKRKKEQ